MDQSTNFPTGRWTDHSHPRYCRAPVSAAHTYDTGLHGDGSQMCLPLTCVYVFICVRYLQWDKLWSHRFKSPVIKTRRGKSIRFFVPCLFYSTERWQHRAAVTDTGPVVRFSDEKTKWINTPVVDAEMMQRLILCRWAWNMHAFLNLKILSLCSQSISLWQSFRLCYRHLIMHTSILCGTIRYLKPRLIPVID